MSKQGVNLTVLDDQLGQTPPGNGNTLVVIGPCSYTTGQGVVYFQPFNSSTPSAFSGGYGYGIGPRLSAFVTGQTGNDVIYCPIPNNSNGVMASTACYPTLGNTTSTYCNVSGNPNDDYYLKALFTGAGTIGAAGTTGTGPQVSLSIDGGKTYPWVTNLGTSATVTTGSPFTNYTGLSLTFSTVAVSLNDSFYNVATGPTFSDAAVQSALASVIAIKSQTFLDVMIPGVSAAADAVAFQSYMVSLVGSKRFSRLLCGLRDAAWGGASTETEAAWMSSTIQAFANNTTDRVGVCAGHYPFLDPFTQSQLRSNLIFGAAVIDSANGIATDLGEVDLGSIPGLSLPTGPDYFGNGKLIYHDEDTTPGFDAARFLSAWQIVDYPGVYIMNPNLMAAPGSDFNWLQHGHVMDEACSLLYGYFISKLSSAFRVSAKTGYILPTERARLNAGAQNVLNNELVTPGLVSAATCTVSGTDNILSTATITVTASIVPLGYAKAFNVTMSFLNPAIVAVQEAA